MKREAFVSLGLWLVYAFGWYSLLQMGGEQYTSVLVVLAIIPSFPMSEWYWGPIDEFGICSFWRNIWPWILRWCVGVIVVLTMGLLVSFFFHQFGYTYYVVPMVWLVFVLLELFCQLEFDRRKWNSA